MVNLTILLQLYQQLKGRGNRSSIVRSILVTIRMQNHSILSRVYQGASFLWSSSIFHAWQNVGFKCGNFISHHYFAFILTFFMFIVIETDSPVFVFNHKMKLTATLIKVDELMTLMNSSDMQHSAFPEIWSFIFRYLIGFYYPVIVIVLENNLIAIYLTPLPLFYSNCHINVGAQILVQTDHEILSTTFCEYNSCTRLHLARIA